MEHLVSILLLTYNHEKFIAQAIESVLMQQTNFKYKIYLGENGSTDKTREICLRYKKNYPDKIELIMWEVNDYFANPLKLDNICFNSGAKYIALLDGDDYWTDEYKLQKQVDFLEANPDFVVCCHPAKIEYDNKRKCLWKEIYGQNQKKEYSLVDMLTLHYPEISPQSMVFRNCLGELPEWYCDIIRGDTAFQLLLADKGKIGFIDDVMAVHRKHEGAVTSLFETHSDLMVFDLIKLLIYYDNYTNYKYHLPLRKYLYQNLFFFLKLDRIKDTTKDQMVAFLQNANLTNYYDVASLLSDKINIDTKYYLLPGHKINNKLVSIITICLNAMPHIKNCIESILAQDYPNIEYIIQDGGSTDGTVEIIKQYAETYPDEIKWASEKDSGHGEAINRALQRCTGEIIGTCNADDMLMPYAIRWAVESFNANPEVGAIYGDYAEIDESGDIKALRSGPDTYDYQRIICVEDVIPMQSTFFRRSALKQAGLLGNNWLPRFCEDFAFWIRIGLKSEIKHLPCVASLYRVHKGSGTHNPKDYRLYYINKREVLERFFIDPQVPQSIKALRNRAIGGLALSIAGMFLIHFGDIQEAFRYICLARAEQPDNIHLSHMGQTIKKWDYALSQIIKYAQDLFNSQRFEEAYAVFDFLTPIDFWYPGIHYIRAVCLQMLGRNTDALLALKQEFALHPDFDVPNPEFFGLEWG